MAMDLQFQLISTSLLRDRVARGELSEVEFAMLRKHGDKLRWGTKEKSTFLDLATDTYVAKNPAMQVEVVIRSLCHSRVVTADYVQRGERFKTKGSILVLGQVGEVLGQWAELAQPALHLFARDFNVVWVEVPAFATNSAKWMRYGPSILAAALKKLSIDSVEVLASGVGGSVFLETLRQSPKSFGKTHMIYNFDLPRGSKALPFSITDIEELLREKELQLWFSYNDEIEVFDRSDWGTAMKAYEAVMKLQARLEGERRRGFRVLDYDEILITEALNQTDRHSGEALRAHVKRIPVVRDAILSFSQEFLSSLALYYDMPPQTYQDDLANGLPPKSYMKKKFRPSLPFPKGADGEFPELPALRRMRLGPPPSDRPAIADINRRRVDRVAAATMYLMPASKRPALPPHIPMGGSKEPAQALRTVSSAPALPSASDMLMLPPGAVMEDDGEESFFDEPPTRALVDRGASATETYHAMWVQLREELQMATARKQAAILQAQAAALQAA